MRLIQLLIFALPWVIWRHSANPYLEPKELFLMAGLWGLGLWASFRPRPLSTGTSQGNPWAVWIALFLVATGLLHFQWAYLQRTLTDSSYIYNVYTWLPTVTVVVALLAIRTLSTRFLVSSTAAQVATQWWCASVALTVAYALLQSLGLDQWYVQPEHMGSRVWTQLMGSFGNPEYLSLYLALLLPLFLLFRSRWYLLGFLAMLGLLWLNHNRGTWLIAGIGLLSYGMARYHGLLRGWKRLVGYSLLGFLMLGGGWAIWHLMQGDERLVIWAKAWGLLQATAESGSSRMVASFTGRGLGAWALLNQQTPWLWVHNEWLEGLVELGVIGMSLVAAMVCWTLRRGWQRATTSLLDAGWFGVLMAWLASTVLYPSAHWAHTAWVGLCAVGILEREGA